jgi:NAD(P)H-dependent FMN reductase
VPQHPPKILVLAGSIRKGSFNQQLADAYAGELAHLECTVTRILLSDYPLPLMDEDLEAEKGVPENAVRLARQFHSHQGIVVVGPEYNGTLTPLTKNTIDWISRVSSHNGQPVVPYRSKPCAIAAASDGSMGGYSSLSHLRHVLSRLGMLVIPEQLSLAHASTAFEEDGSLKEGRPRTIMEAACRSIVEKARLLG